MCHQIYPQYWHLVVQNGNFTLLLTSRGQEWQLANLLVDLTPQYWHLVVWNGNFTLLLISSGKEWQLADLPADLLPGYWHLVVQNGNCTLLLMSSGQENNWLICQKIYPPVLTSSGPEWQLADLPADLPPPVLTSSGQECQFYIATDMRWSWMAISHCYWHLVVKNGNFTLLLTWGGHEWQFHIATDI